MAAAASAAGGGAGGDQTPHNELEHKSCATCWTNRKKLYGVNQCGMCNAWTVVTKRGRSRRLCKWCLTLSAYEQGRSMCAACIAEDDSLRRFTEHLYNGTMGQRFLQWMTLPEQGPTKYRRVSDVTISLHQQVDEPPLADDDRLRPCQLADLRRRVATLAAEYREVALHAAWEQGLDAQRGIEADLLQSVRALEDAMSSDQALEEGMEGRRFRRDLLQRTKRLESSLGSLCFGRECAWGWP